MRQYSYPPRRSTVTKPIVVTAPVRNATSTVSRYILLVTKDSQPVEVLLTPGSCAKVSTFEGFAFDLPAGATIYADRGYTDYDFEDDFSDVDGLVGSQFLPMREANSKRPFPPWVRYLQHLHRKRVETASSLTEQLLHSLGQSKTALTQRFYRTSIAHIAAGCYTSSLTFSCHALRIASLGSVHYLVRVSQLPSKSLYPGILYASMTSVTIFRWDTLY